MHVSLDNISFYSHPPIKTSSRALPASCWKAYAPLAPQPLPRPQTPRPHSHGTTFDSTSAAIDNVLQESRAAGKESLASRAGGDFDIELERAMGQTSQVTHEADLNIHLNSEAQGELHNSMPQGDRTPLLTDHSDLCSLVEALGDFDTASIPAEPQLHDPGAPVVSTVAPTDLLRWRRESISSLGTYDETDKDSSLPEANLPRPRSLLHSLDVSAQETIETVMHDEPLTDHPNSDSENHEDRPIVPEDEVTKQVAPTNQPGIDEAIPHEVVRGRFIEGSSSPASSRLGPRTRSVSQSQAALANVPSLRPRQKATSNQRERFSPISVVIPVHRNDEFVAGPKKNLRTTRPRYRCQGKGDSGEESGNLDHYGKTQTSTGNKLPGPGRSHSKVRGHRANKSKTAKKKQLPSSNSMIQKCTGQAQTGDSPSISLDETQEIFGRGVLRIQSHGPRHAYFMTFLPEAPHRPSMPSPSEMRHDQSSHPNDFPENSSVRQVACRGCHKRTKSAIRDDRDVWSGSTKRPRTGISKQTSLSKDDQLLINLKEQRQLSWNGIAEHFPGRSKGSLQVRYSTRLKRRDFGISPMVLT
ncbi:hypothetical protein N7492_002634 [Penicillium capsulatum]|uniref:Myb-like domain-containing protein n=1 Tax=Penicillium capsulatum TaxID=69766 RepID=A0A9W9LW76_9EURO|nr:hypothetical protein N7492_002634 [Penicillium capsulatum]KAJ6122765.1 hypothetical protein N7512_005230 [Penicillium capsulatum]